MAQLPVKHQARIRTAVPDGIDRQLRAVLQAEFAQTLLMCVLTVLSLMIKAWRNSGVAASLGYQANDLAFAVR